MITLRSSVLLFVLLVPSLPARAAEARWTALGPYGGDLSALAVAPGARRTLYAALVYDGVFRSVDAGVHWEKAASLDRWVFSLAVDPADPLRVYAGVGPLVVHQSGVLVSTDGGLTWSPAAGPGSARVSEVAVDPVDPDVLFGAALEGLIASHDRGESWQAVPSLALDPPEISAVRFEGTGAAWALSPGSGLFRSLDGGTSWQARSPVLPAGASVAAFGLDPANPGTLYAVLAPGSGSTAGDVDRSTDGGGTWSRRGSAGPSVSALAVSPDGTVLYAGTGSGVRRSLDGGATWEAGPVIFGGRATSVLAVPPSPPGVVYADSAGLGVLKSGDRGASWQWASRGLESSFVDDVVAAPRGGSFLYASQQQLGLRISTDRGANWRPWTGPASGRLAVSPWDGRTVWSVTTSGEIVETHDAGTTTSRRQIDGGFCLEPGALAVDPRQPATLQVAGVLTNTCLRGHLNGCLAFGSTDGGITWTCNQKPGRSYFTVAFDPARPGTRYAAGLDGVDKSTDGGRTWTAANRGLPATAHVVGDLACTPAGVLYIGTHDGVYLSRDGAHTWKRASTGMAPGEIVDRLAFAPSNPAMLYAASVHGPALLHSIYESTDGGAHWRLLSEPGLPEGLVTALTVDPRQQQTLYVGTETGVYRLDRP